jgi:glutamyl-tRNA synthetase
VTQDGEVAGACELPVSQELNRVVQFERVGFVKIDAVDQTGIRAYFTHK